MRSARDAAGVVLWVLAAVTAANAFWMLAQPTTWFRELPAGVPDFGPYNEHFVRDIGIAFAAVALALGWAARRPPLRTPLIALAAFFLVGHGLLHVFDTLRGAVGSEHWWLDFPGVYVPAAATLWLFLDSRSKDRIRPPAPPSQKGVSHASRTD